MYTTEIKFGPLTGASICIGAGFGGMLDIILFHQVFQLHQMLSAKVTSFSLAGLKFNLFWDGVLQLPALLLMCVGIISLWKLNENPYTPRASKVFYGSLLFGWGSFIILEGIVNHLLLEIHHVLESAPADEKLFWDVSHIVLGCFIGLIGRWLVSRGKKIFFREQVEKARKKPFRFRPAFNPRTALFLKRANTHQQAHVSNNYH